MISTFFDILLDTGDIPKNKLEQAVSIAEEQGRSLFHVLLDQNFVTEEWLLKLLSQATHIPLESIDKGTIDFKISHLIPESFARDNYILPLFRIGNTLTLAINNPFMLHVLEESELITNMDINLILTSRSNMDALFNYSYAYQEDDPDDEHATMSSLFEMGLKLLEDKNISDDEIYDLAQEAPIAKLVDSIIKQAITEKASDIHIEPEDTVVKIRYRIDGILKDIMSPPKKLEAPIISRIKILANLDITETRKPQDGRISISLKDREIDLRVSAVRTINGEKLVLRVLDKSGAFVSLDKLGMSNKNYAMMQSLISSTSGIVLVCGPTGSGKTSTLYSSISSVNSPDKNIITIEDPVEYSLEGINQMQVNPKIGVDFVTGLTAVVRQDPDIIMVGEIRDVETASIAIQASLTGHLVFSTLHTRNASGAITRLIEMGIQPFLLNSSINGIVGQRLVRTICTNCKKELHMESIQDIKQRELLSEIKERYGTQFQLFEGGGCKYCDHSGYRGRTGIFEILLINDAIRQLVIDKASSTTIHEVALGHGMTSLKEDGIQKVLNGITTIGEVTRVLDI